MLTSLVEAPPPRGMTCCRSPGRVSISECIDRGLCRNRQEPLSIVGCIQHNSRGLAAQFSLDIHSQVIHLVRFKATGCVTLIAYCELLAEWVTGSTLREAISVSPAHLAAALDGVPAYKRDLALLATTAFHAAIAKGVIGGK
jgi:NifU-like protein involved in Fe-S cluster formation